MKVTQGWTPNVIIGQAEESIKSSVRNLYRQFKEKFGHIEGATIVGVHHKNAVITLMERLSKVNITLKPNGRKASNIELAMNRWFKVIPRNLFHSITFDFGKEFSN